MCWHSSSACRRIIAATSPSVGSVATCSPGERRRQVAEQPRPAQAAAADDDAGGTGLLDHPQRVGGLPDVAVAEHRDVDVLDQLARSRPSRPCPE